MSEHERDDLAPITRAYGHGGIKLTANPSFGRIITTTEELDALPARSMILDDDPDALRKMHSGDWRSLVAPEEPFKSIDITLPVTVLYEPPA